MLIGAAQSPTSNVFLQKEYHQFVCYGYSALVNFDFSGLLLDFKCPKYWLESETIYFIEYLMKNNWLELEQFEVGYHLHELGSLLILPISTLRSMLMEMQIFNPYSREWQFSKVFSNILLPDSFEKDFL